MADLNDILSSLSADDVQKLKSVASSIMGDKSQNNETALSQNKSVPFLPFDMDTMNKAIKVMNAVGQSDDRTKLISDLKPLLSEERQRKADNAIKFLQLTRILPYLKGKI